MNYGQIKARFKARFRRRDLNLDAELVDHFLQEGVLRTQRQLRIPPMEKSIVVDIGDTFTGLAIPGDYLQLIAIEDVDNENQLRRESLTRVKQEARNAGVPRVFCRQGGSWYVGPTPQSGSKIRIDYYAEFPEFNSDSDDTVITKVIGSAFLYGALSYACDEYSDERFQRFDARYKEIMDELQAMADSDELTADAAVAPAYVWPED